MWSLWWPPALQDKCNKYSRRGHWQSMCRSILETEDYSEGNAIPYDYDSENSDLYEEDTAAAFMGTVQSKNTN